MRTRHYERIRWEKKTVVVDIILGCTIKQTEFFVDLKKKSFKRPQNNVYIFCDTYRYSERASIFVFHLNGTRVKTLRAPR